LPPVFLKQTVADQKLMVPVVWNPHGFHVIQSLPKGVKSTGRYYSENILSQIAAPQDVCNHRKTIVYADNASLYDAKCVTDSMDYHSLKRVPHPSCSPDLAPSNFYLFGYVKHQLQGHEFTEGPELVSAISEISNQIPTDTPVDILITELEGSSDVFISVESMSNTDYFSLFIDFHESLTLVMLQSWLNNLCSSFNALDVGELRSETSVMKPNVFYPNVSDVHVSADHWCKADELKANIFILDKDLAILR
jgi:hypothetical protein